MGFHQACCLELVRLTGEDQFREVVIAETRGKLREAISEWDNGRDGGGRRAFSFAVNFG